ncbi:MAG: hypothetical protein A2934_03395 [Candidatus Sungbacteria bacterium RIFCSPLOWO2_01_FULL_47_10]|uniref:Prepilin peptidase A24 N-terminal domain-containing protein n=1 Tax=Candidatus Sungbacteria bacterium RIFCSPLOWO2_01_FULL_47_10 TaxID=1802276 RepID=A0A1G2L6C1_9BACT|nr:MAG: hypothetical protein A2934_03395 [Candidatus Sungbacteria bacterium RIFCSPLOWO2_01_FULL_47_10]
MIFLFLLPLVFGLVIGSFLNVVIFRLEPDEGEEKPKAKNTPNAFGVFSIGPRSQNMPRSHAQAASSMSILTGRSFCPHCKTQLKWFELIPLFSFTIQKGRCRTCHNKISWQYPLVELGAAVVFTLIAWQYISGNI